MNQDEMKTVEVVVKAADNKKAEDVMVLDMHGLSVLADYFIIMHGNSDRQVNAITDGILEAANKEGLDIKRVEGKDTGNWLLIDMYDVIVHVFQSETRNFYNLEKLWADADLVDISEWVTE